jgi:hypothetical protein
MLEPICMSVVSGTLTLLKFTPSASNQHPIRSERESSKHLHSVKAPARSIIGHTKRFDGTVKPLSHLQYFSFLACSSRSPSSTILLPPCPIVRFPTAKMQETDLVMLGSVSQTRRSSTHFASIGLQHLISDAFVHMCELACALFSTTNVQPKSLGIQLPKETKIQGLSQLPQVKALSLCNSLLSCEMSQRFNIVGQQF